MPPSRCLIVGLGPIGVLYGFILAQGPDVELTVVARSTYAPIVANGIDFRSTVFGEHLWRPRIVRNVAEAIADGKHYDYVLVTTKWIPEVADTASLLAPCLVPDSHGHLPTVFLVQNGVGIEADLQAAYPALHIISCIAWGNANLSTTDDGQVLVRHGTLHRIGLGLYEGPDAQAVAAFDPQRRAEGKERARAWAELLKAGGGEPELHDDMQRWRFIKLLWNGSWSVLSCMSRCSTYDLVLPENVEQTKIAIRGFIDEVAAVAKASGYDIPEERKAFTISMTIEGARPGGTGIIWPGFRPSLHVDLEAGRPMELESCVGSIIARGRAHSVPTPRFDLVYAALRPHQLIAVAKAKGG